MAEDELQGRRADGNEREGGSEARGTFFELCGHGRRAKKGGFREELSCRRKRARVRKAIFGGGTERTRVARSGLVQRLGEKEKTN